MKKFVAAVIALIILATVTVFAASPLFDTPYIGNSYRMTFHYRDCESVLKMNRENQYPLNSVEEAYQKGFSPCGNCRPDIPRP